MQYLPLDKVKLPVRTPCSRGVRAKRPDTSRFAPTSLTAMLADDDERIDCHAHVFDPARFPYAADTFYRPAGQELGTARQFARVLEAHGVRHALLVGPNSGYETDNGCLLDAVAGSGGRFKGVAVVTRDAGTDALRELQSRGIVGVAFNAAHHGTAYYAGTGPLLARLEALGLWLQLQVEGDQLTALLPLLDGSGVRLLIDHCGRPRAADGVGQAGFAALLALGRERAPEGRMAVKLSGGAKFSGEPAPHADLRPYLDALVDAFTLDACVWGSDWPFLRAPERIDYGPLLAWAEAALAIDAAGRRKLMWETPKRLFGFEGEESGDVAGARTPSARAAARPS
jgi:predicted TIM-barrel fold metal-dependent hydrolase